MSYVTPDWVNAVRDLAIILGFLVALCGAIIAVGRWLIVKPMIRLIDERTRQIQPDANGGKSLSDLHLKLDDMAIRMSRVERELLRIDEELEDIG
jgi:hypothetical protein